MALPAAASRLTKITAAWAYSSGAKHRAYDYAMPIGTPLFAVQDGVIVACNDGVANQPIGRPAGSGAPSNWIQLVCKHPRTKEVITVYYQHLNKGLKVKKGQTVKAGQLIGYSGNSGNTTGPHLHLAVGKGNDVGKRYDYLRDGDAIWTPATVYPNPAPKITPLSATTKVGKVGWQVSDLRYVLYKAGFLSKTYATASDNYDGNVSAAVRRFHASSWGKKYAGGDNRQIGPLGWKALQYRIGRR
jgi:murein DD-endopeptidase MepM/ murein hydrolase activator NlpD